MLPALRQPTHAISIIIFVLATGLLFGIRDVQAQDTAPSDSVGAKIDGQIEKTRAVLYRARDLRADDMLYLYVHTTDGALDPVLYVLDSEADVMGAGQAAIAEARAADIRGEDPLTAYAASIDAATLAWDDDSGAGYDAALALKIPEDGDYLIVVDANIATPDSTGEFELLAGINAPEVLEGELPAGRGLDIRFDETVPIEAVQEITGTLTLTAPETIIRLDNVRLGNTLTAFVEPTAGDLTPMLMLEDYGGKMVAANNIHGTQPSAVVEHTFTEDPSGWRLRVAAASASDQATAGDYRLLLGLNAPDVRSGDAEVRGPEIQAAPIPVTITLQIDQITGVNQQAENFGIVANMLAEFHDPSFAFSPDSCHCDVKRFRSEKAMNSYLGANDINVFPELLLFNLQGGRSLQQMMLEVSADGSVTYFERFAATLQAPDFNFRQFPFDTQQFYVRVQSLLEREFYTLAPNLARSGFGAQLGEEEWIFTNDEFTAEVVDYRGRDQLAFGFTTHRHLNYYIFRILLPVLIIILISWISFFLHDYNRRIEVAGANLLAFIAYNFTISSDLPRIGYLTFMDMILISTFVVSGLVLVVNILFRQLERSGREEVVAKLDPIMLWLYPLLYVVGGFVVYLIFFSR